MKLSNLRLVLPTAVLAMAFSATGWAEDSGKADFSKQALQAKIEYCKTCHGVSGQGVHGSIPIPRLAGQQTEYIENQLAAFIEHRRDNKYMFNVSHVLSASMRATLAKNFNELNPKPLGGAPKELVASGKILYEQGVPDHDVPPCASCHGPEAKGAGEFPRLAGQLNDYILSKLTNWNKERGRDQAKPDASAIMQPIAHNLTKPQIEAIAAYVNYLE